MKPYIKSITTETKRTEKRFDYAAAWVELALPAFGKLDPRAVDLYRTLRDAEVYENLQQRSGDLLVPIPEELRARFEAIPSDALATAARVLHDLGHWQPRGRLFDPGAQDHRGATWKFASMADQILAERLQMPNFRGVARSIGWTFQ